MAFSVSTNNLLHDTSADINDQEQIYYDDDDEVDIWNINLFCFVLLCLYENNENMFFVFVVVTYLTTIS